MPLSQYIILFYTKSEGRYKCRHGRAPCAGVELQYILDSGRERETGMDASDRIESPQHNSSERKCPFLYEQHNTGHEVQTIPFELRPEIRSQPSQQKIQQEPILHLLLAETMGRYGRFDRMPVKTSSPASPPAYRTRAEVDQRHASAGFQSRDAGILASASKTRILPLS